MKRSVTPILLSLALLFSGGGQVKADLFTFTYSDGNGNVGNGTLTASALGGGEFLATSGTLDVTGGGAVGTYLLYPGGPGVTSSPYGTYIYDDVLYPTSNPSLDFYGLLFRESGLEINIYSTTSPIDYHFDYSNGLGNNTESSSPGLFTLQSSVPEPSTLWTAVGGICAGIAYGWSRRRREKRLQRPGGQHDASK